jgi:hypothetical protein
LEGRECFVEWMFFAFFFVLAKITGLTIEQIEVLEKEIKEV